MGIIVGFYDFGLRWVKDRIVSGVNDVGGNDWVFSVIKGVVIFCSFFYSGVDFVNCNVFVYDGNKFC